jgi:glycosyltransferase involved in cell wall biosynthesis
METYLATLNIFGIVMTPLFHTVKGERGVLFDTLFVRMTIDCYRIIKALYFHHVDCVHMLGTTGSAMPRAAFLALISKLKRVPFIYDIKAGTFIINYETRGRLYKTLVRFIVGNSAVVLVEGEIYEHFILREFGAKAHFFPNFVDDAVIPESTPERLAGDELRVLFVGYCYEGKGVVDLVKGCIRVARSGLDVMLTLIGEEELNFRDYLDNLEWPEGFHVNRLGRRDYEDVRSAMLRHDIFCFPSRHIGEGHSNAINEAMMSGMVIACTRHGFLESVVGEDIGYFMNTGSADEVERVLVDISSDRPTARARAKRAKLRLEQEYTSSVACQRLSRAYQEIFSDLASARLSDSELSNNGEWQN